MSMNIPRGPKPPTKTPPKMMGSAPNSPSWNMKNSGLRPKGKKIVPKNALSVTKRKV